ncbi:hypothetical protein GPX89_41640 [Nocardia sp. ET3-3]|uniref:Uncharacterized protein n=1 Tax=Nocardia terrae TaxID=2675851 RepID=A0A7K1VAU4_9NOCA|nr:hypothetical protein [Nocardia terrae]
MTIRESRAAALFETMGRDPRLDATALQTVGLQGWDGFTLAVVGWVISVGMR